AGCGAGAPEPKTPPAPKASQPKKRVTMITPSRLVPEVDTKSLGPWFIEPGLSKYVLGGLRIVVRDDGGVERANQRFPAGLIQPLPLPDRLGGGYLFYQSDSQGTRIWRAPGWTDDLEPLATLGPAVEQI